MAFVAGSLGLKGGVHVGVKFLVQMAPETIARWIGLITNLVLFLFYLVLIVEGFRVMGLVASQRLPVVRVSMTWIYSSLPVGAVIFSFFVLSFIFEDVKGLWKETA